MENERKVNYQPELPSRYRKSVDYSMTLYLIHNIGKKKNVSALFNISSLRQLSNFLLVVTGRRGVTVGPDIFYWTKLLNEWYKFNFVVYNRVLHWNIMQNPAFKLLPPFNSHKESWEFPEKMNCLSSRRKKSYKQKLKFTVLQLIDCSEA